MEIERGEGRQEGENVGVGKREWGVGLGGFKGLGILFYLREFERFTIRESGQKGAGCWDPRCVPVKITPIRY